MGFFSTIIEKLNPAQGEIVDDYGDKHDTTAPYSIRTSYYQLDIVNRGVNLVIDSAAGIKFDIADKLRNIGVVVPTKETRFTKDRLIKLLNFAPNPYQNSNVFFRDLYLDLLLEGKCIHLLGWYEFISSTCQ